MSKILIVDDDPDFVQITSLVLQNQGYELLTAANGSEALALMRQEAPALILLDIMMDSILDGLNVSEEMQSEPGLRDVPIIMISSIADTEHASAFPTDSYVHMDAWLTKPIKPEELLKKVRQYLH